MFGEETRDRVRYEAMLEQYELVHPVEFWLLLSREDWHGHTGYVPERRPAVVSDTGLDADYYLCGVPAAVVAGKKNWIGQVSRRTMSTRKAGRTHVSLRNRVASAYLRLNAEVN